MAHPFLAFTFCATLAMLTAVPIAAGAETGKLSVYVGTYTSAKTGSKGIYRFEFDPTTGQLKPAGLVAEAVNPSFLAIHPNGKYLYTVGESTGAQGKGGTVTAFGIEADGKLARINDRPSGGSAPCHLVVDKAGKNVIAANYGSGHQAVLQVKPNGELTDPVFTMRTEGHGPDAKRQEGPHAHCVTLDTANRHAIITDLGTDTVWVHEFHADTGVLGPKNSTYHTAPGAGPRHFAFSRDGKRGYLINELNSTLTALAYDADRGVLTPLQTVSTLPWGYKGDNTCAEVVVHPSGKFVYGSNRGYNSIAEFAIEPDGKMRPIGEQREGIKTPRNFNIDPSGKWMIVANQAGNSLVVFKIDPQTGVLGSTGIQAEVGSPVCVTFWPINK